MSEFDNIKEGDEICLSVNYGRGMTLHKVIKTTPTLFMAGHYTFYKKNGRIRGSSGYGGPYSALVATPEHREQAEAYMLKRWAKEFQFSALPTETLKQIRAIADAATTKTDSN